MSDRAVIAGVGMTAFASPSRSRPYREMAEEAVRLAIGDSGLDYRDLQQAYVGYVYGDSTCGQAVLYGLGLTGIPIFNLNNNCSTGSTALFLARQAVQSGAVECALALGFEQMNPGALGAIYTDRDDPMERFHEASERLQPDRAKAPVAAQLFGGAGIEYQQRYGMPDHRFAEVAVKSRRHAALNPAAVFNDLLTVEEVMASPHIFGPLTRLQCCPPTCGAAAAVVCSERFAREHGASQPIAILSQAMTTDGEGTFTDDSMIKVVGYGMASAAAAQAYEEAGLGPDEIDVCELHDCFTANEVISYEALGFTPEGTAERFIADGDNSYGGRIVVNPSGGLLSKGHPLGATGLAQCTELVLQLRGRAGARQVEGAEIALQHNLGLGGACVVTLYGQV